MGVLQSAMAHSPQPLARHEKLVALLRANHSHYEVYFNHRVFHNHMAHILGAAYILGATSKQLGEIYDADHGELVPWQEDSPQEVTYEDWRSYLGNKDYIRGFRDFFDDDIDDNRFNYKKTVLSFVTNDRDIASLFSGLLHSAISLQYALELDSKEVAGEALNLWAGDYIKDSVWKIEEPLLESGPSTGTHPQPLTGEIVLQLFDAVRKDPNFLNMSSHPMATAKQTIAEKVPGAGKHLKVYFDMVDWDSVVSSKETIDAAVDSLLYASTALLCGTHRDDKFDFSFFLMHALSGAWALKIILPLFETHRHSVMIAFKAYMFEILCVYIGQSMPRVDVKRITDYSCKNLSWDYVVDRALNGPDRFEVHYVKALRVLKDQNDLLTKRFRSQKSISQPQDDKKQEEILDFYKKAAVMLAAEFPHGWIGFPSSKTFLDISVGSSDAM